MIRTSSDGPVTTLLLDAPERRNAFDEAMLRQLGAGLQAADADPGCRCVVVRGAGGTFCAGRNLTEAPERGIEAVLDREGIWEEISQTLHRASTPSVAVVDGHAVAGGFTLAMACDFVVAEASATFGAFEMRHGFPAALCTPLLAKLAPARMALEWGMLGQPIPARRLYEIGLVNRIAEGTDALDEVAAEFVGHLAALDPQAVAMTLELHRAAANLPRADALAMGKQQNALITTSGMLERAMRRFTGRSSS